MARSYAKIMTAIWRNREFRNLEAGPQRVYLLLVTQPDITAAGTLPLTVRRWAEAASDTSVQDITTALTTLAGKRFIAFDRETEELLVRSFVKWDGGYTNSKRRPVIFRAAEEIASSALRQVLATEFARLELPGAFLLDTASDRASDALSDGDDDPGGMALPPPDQEALFPQVDSLSDTASDAVSASDGVVVTEVSTGEPTSHKPQAVPPTAGDAAPGTQQIVGSWLEQCRKRPPRNVIGQISKNVKTLLEEGIDPADVQAGLLEWANKSLHPSTLPSVVNEVMNRQQRPALRAVSGGYTPWQNPTDQSAYDEDMY